MAKKATAAAPKAPRVVPVVPPPATQKVVANRYDFLYLFDVKRGNPNGDPAAGNMPRQDAMNGIGWVSDVCLKRKVRNYVQIVHGEKPGQLIFIRDGSILNHTLEDNHAAIGTELHKDLPDGTKRKTMGVAQGVEIELAREQMCRGYWDVRAFGGVMNTGPKNGQVTGPVQFTTAASYDVVDSQETKVTRCAITTEDESIDHNGANQTFGSKWQIPYALYSMEGYIMPSRAAQTGFGEDDLAFLWHALRHMWAEDRSAARGTMACVKLVVFKHASLLGNAFSRDLFERVKVAANIPLPRSYRDYTITIDQTNLPAGVELLLL